MPEAATAQTTQQQTQKQTISASPSDTQSVAPPPATGATDATNEWKQKFELKTKESIAQRRNLESALKKAQAEVAEKTAKLVEAEKLSALAKRNPTGYLEKVYGDKYWDKLVEARVNGVAPADMMAEELEKLEAKFESRLQARDQEAKAAAERQQQQQVAHAKQQLLNEAANFVTQAGKDYPILSELGDSDAIARSIAQRVESEYFRTQVWQGNQLVRDGRVLTNKEAAELIEGELVKIGIAAYGTDKYKAKFQLPLQSKTAPGNVALSSEKQQVEKQQARKTLSNNLTGSTQGRNPPISAQERRERALARYAELARK